MDDKQQTYRRLVEEYGDWDQFANNVETQRRLRIVFDRLLGNVPLDGVSFLDAGSGGGHFSAEAEKRGAKVTALDVSETLLNGVRRRAGGRVECVVGSVEALPFSDGAFDVVLSTEVIEHVRDPMKALMELGRVVRPGGVLVVTTPVKLWQPIVRFASGVGVRKYQGYENFLWPRQLRRCLEEMGFGVDELFGFNILPLFHPAFVGILQLTDHFGSLMPWGFVNVAVRGRKMR